jgi:hypothetical protein
VRFRVKLKTLLAHACIFTYSSHIYDNEINTEHGERH